MNKRLLVAAVFALAVLTLGVAAAPALAAYPVTWDTETAYVHVWWGNDQIVWTEFDAPVTDPNANWNWHSGEEAIPAHYDVCIAMMVGDFAPKGQVAKWANLMRAEFTMDGPDPQMPLVIGTKEARRYWNPPEVWFLGPTINKENGSLWMLSWTLDLGALAPGTYEGTSAWSAKQGAVGFGIPDPLPEEGPLKPTHWTWGDVPPPSAFEFTVADLPRGP